MTALADAFDKAADWLEAHPNKHIQGALAGNKNGSSIDDILQGECFCALGRIGYELGYNRSWEIYGDKLNDALFRALPGEDWIDSSEPVEDIYTINDKEWGSVNLHIGSAHRRLGNPAVIPALRDYAKRMREAQS